MSILKQALESIDFQNREFGETLERYFALIKEKYKDINEINKSEEIKAIQDFTFKRTGIKVKLKVNKGDGGYTMIPLINSNHIFLDPIFRGLEVKEFKQNLLKLKKFKEESTIDIKNAKVTGMFSIIESPIVLGMGFFKSNFSPAEITATYLHELGHIFTTYEFIGNTAITNQALACVVKSLNEAGSAGSEKHVVVLKELGKTISGENDLFEDLVNVTDRAVITTVIVDRVNKETRSLTGSSNYDLTASESLADVFATRFGYGKELVTALAKIHKEFSSPEYSTVVRLSMLWVDSCNYVWLPLFIILNLSSVPFQGPILILFMIFLAYLRGERLRDYTYDDLKVRYLRVKEQIITSLKNKNIDAKEKAEKLAALKIIDKHILEVKERLDFVRIISNFVFSNNRREKKAIELQRDLESLAANSIYAKAAELSLIK